jgi:hypothetical protein
VRRGYLLTSSLVEFLRHYPPLIHSLNGEATQGGEGTAQPTEQRPTLRW